ncbi:hypothetical protein F5Y09DRAFT_312865 [Xylaria sp. FL1042]|nr:hypothetical protein F5Y09DRAFT_312865 [Xylaria sp. FL1042]
MQIPRQNALRTSQSTSASPPSTRELSFPQTIIHSGSNNGDGDEAYLFDVSSSQRGGADTMQGLTSEVSKLADEAPKLAESILEEFLLASSPPTCGNTVGDRFEQRRRTSWFKKRMGIEQKPDSDEEDIGLPSLTKSHLPCPFYVRQKQKYRSCLTRVDLREIRDLTQHLESEHRQPLYCPTCYDTFVSATDWEEHIRRRSCVSSNKPRPEGVTVLQIQELARRDEHCVSQELQWLLIWEIVFPGAKSPSPAFPSGGVEIMVWMVRDFWSAEGDKIMSNFLTKKQLYDDQISSGTLGPLVLNLVIDQLVEKCVQDKSDDQGYLIVAMD